MLNRKALFNLLQSQPFPGRDSAAWAEGAAIRASVMKKRAISGFLRALLILCLRPLIYAWLWLLWLTLSDEDKEHFP